jgi:hypothetical protein
VCVLGRVLRLRDSLEQDSDRSLPLVHGQTSVRVVHHGVCRLVYMVGHTVGLPLTPLFLLALRSSVLLVAKAALRWAENGFDSEPQQN